MILIRSCRGFEELQACVDLQVEVWGYCEGDVIPRRMFLVAQKIGGQVLGAFDTELPGAPPEGDAASLVGFNLALPGVKTGKQADGGRPVSYLHSHMLAVKEGYRDRSVGRRLKLAQREDALARGIERIEWTFDPLEIKNSFLNIHKLGAIVRSYEENFYGVSSSRLQGGLQTDRLVAEWWIASPRVARAIEGQSLSSQTDTGAPVAPAGDRQRALTIVVPAAIYQWKSDDRLRHLAKQVQEENRIQFQKAFREGLTVVGFERDREGNGIFELDPWPELEGEIELEPVESRANE